MTKAKKTGLIIPTLGAIGLKVSSAGLGFLNGVLLARLLEPKEFGVYSVLIAIATLSSTVAGFGVGTFMTRETATYIEKKQWGLFKGLINESRKLLLLSSFIVMLMLMQIYRFNLLKVDDLSFLLILLLMLLITFNQQRAGILRGMHHVLLADAPEMVFRQIIVLMILFLCLFSIGKADSYQAMLIQLISVVIAFIIGQWLVYSRQPIELKTTEIEIDRKKWFLSALPFFGATLVSVIQVQISIYILDYRSDSYQVGLFQVASQLVNLVTIGLQAINMPLQPRIASAWARNDNQSIQNLVSQAVRISTIMALAVGLIMLVFSKQLLLLYGKSYGAAEGALYALTISQLFSAFSGSCGLVLAMTGHQRYVMISQILALVINSAVAWVMTPEWGATGAAIATTLGLVIWNMAMVIITLRKIHINTTLFRLIV